MIVNRTADEASGVWARGLRRVTRSRTQARHVYDRTSRWHRFVEEPFERRARTAGLDLLRVQPGERVVELGCGAGGALIALARATGQTGRVVGLDLSPGMISRAAARLRRAGLVRRARCSGLAQRRAFRPEDRKRPGSHGGRAPVKRPRAPREPQIRKLRTSPQEIPSRINNLATESLASSREAREILREQLTPSRRRTVRAPRELHRWPMGPRR